MIEAAPPEAGAQDPIAPAETLKPEVLELEFSLPVSELARFARFPVLSALRQGRIGSSLVDIQWLDQADGAVAGSGEFIEVPRRGPQRLVSLRPASKVAWHPGMVLEPMETLDPRESHGGDPPEPLIPLAAFTGRRRSQKLILGTAVVGLSLLQGQLRSVLAEREVARLRLSGPAPAVLDVARRLVAAFPLLPPEHSLAAEALSLATGLALGPQRHGAPDTTGAESVEACFTQAIGHLLEVALYFAPIARAGAGTEGVHQLRVALRRLRSVLKVFRQLTDSPQSRALDAALRDFLTLLGPARDWDVFLAGIGAEMARLLPEDRRLRSLIRAAETERQKAYDKLAEALAAPGWRSTLLEGIALIHEKPWRHQHDADILEKLAAPPEDFASLALDKRWRRLAKAGAEIETLDAEALHELRLDAKRLRYAAEVLAPVFGQKAARRFQRRLSKLQDELGVSNDASVARSLVRQLEREKDTGRSWAIGVVEGWCLARSAADRDAILDAWEKLKGKDSFWSGD
jgi:CHAD domain-containing protein